jgi:hypothetical protein
MRRTNRLLLASLCLLVCASPVAAQSAEPSFQAGVNLAAATSSEFETTSPGVSGRLSWSPIGLVGVEGELGWYPGDVGDRVAFSGGLVEGLFGGTIGPRLGRLRPFARLRTGFLTFQEAPEPIACILIFPPPIHCTLATGATVFALDAGGGVEFFASDRTALRVDLGDRAVRYPSPVIDGTGAIRDDAFFSHDFRVALGGALRF